MFVIVSQLLSQSCICHTIQLKQHEGGKKWCVEISNAHRTRLKVQNNDLFINMLTMYPVHGCEVDSPCYTFI